MSENYKSLEDDQSVLLEFENDLKQIVPDTSSTYVANNTWLNSIRTRVLSIKTRVSYGFSTFKQTIVNTAVATLNKVTNIQYPAFITPNFSLSEDRRYLYNDILNGVFGILAVGSLIYTYSINKIPQTIFGVIFLAIMTEEYLKKRFVPKPPLENISTSIPVKRRCVILQSTLWPQVDTLSNTLYNGAPKPVFRNYPKTGDYLTVVNYLKKTLLNTGYIKAINELRKIDVNIELVIVNKRWIQRIDPKCSLIIGIEVLDRTWDEVVGPTANTVITSVKLLENRVETMGKTQE